MSVTDKWNSFAVTWTKEEESIYEKQRYAFKSSLKYIINDIEQTTVERLASFIQIMA